MKKVKTIWDYSKLRGKIREVFGTNEAFADAMGMNLASVSLKLNNKSRWNHEEMAKACEILGVGIDEVHAYFFVAKL